ncbi:MAG: lipopolysaccharide biosynthesis protein, partial [Bacteroidota bacterium]
MKFLKEISLGTFNYGLGKFIPQLVGFFLIPVYTAFLTPNDYGIVESTMAIANFTMILMRLALPGSISRYYFDYGEGKELSDYITTLHRTLLAVSVIVGAACYFVLQESLHLIFPGLPFWPFIAIILVTTFLNTNSETQKRLLQARKMSRYSAILNIVTSLVGIVL